MNGIEFESSEVDILISSLILLSKNDQIRLEELYNIKVGSLVNKLYSIKMKSYNIEDMPCCNESNE